MIGGHLSPPSLICLGDSASARCRPLFSQRGVFRAE
jgi:hypothetical protein